MLLGKSPSVFTSFKDKHFRIFRRQKQYYKTPEVLLSHFRGFVCTLIPTGLFCIFHVQKPLAGFPSITSVNTAGRVFLHNFFRLHRRLSDPGKRLINIQGLLPVLIDKQRNPDSSAFFYRCKNRIMISDLKKFFQFPRILRDIHILRFKPAAFLDCLIVSAVRTDLLSRILSTFRSCYIQWN